MEEVWRLNEFAHTPFNTLIAGTDIDKGLEKNIHERGHLNTRARCLKSNYSHKSLDTDTDEVECVYVLCILHCGILQSPLLSAAITLSIWYHGLL